MENHYNLELNLVLKIFICLGFNIKFATAQENNNLANSIIY